MIKISGLKKQILLAKKQGNTQKAIDLLSQLSKERRKQPKATTAKQAYAQLADSP